MRLREDSADVNIDASAEQVRHTSRSWPTEP